MGLLAIPAKATSEVGDKDAKYGKTPEYIHELFSLSAACTGESWFIVSDLTVAVSRGVFQNTIL